MADRYEVRVYRTSKFKKPGNKDFTTYGVWDNQENHWVINSTKVGREKAETILYMLEQHKANKKKKR